jgi:pimeloyl-ACP methyl ester carboxylesterase
MSIASVAQLAVSGQVAVDGASLFYELTGPVDGETCPIVLLHAGIADARMWDPQVEILAGRFSVLRYDLRGFGRSDPAVGRYSARADLIGLLDALGIARVHLVGLSMGGALAIDVALEYPDRVASVVACAARPGGQEPSRELVRGWADVDIAIEAGDLDLAGELELRMWVDGPLRRADEVDLEVRERVREMNAALLAGPDEGQPEPLDPPALTRLHQITAPTLVVVGDRDQPDVIAGAHLLSAGIPNATRQTIPGAAHMISMERPDAFNRAVLTFLASVEGV